MDTTKKFVGDSALVAINVEKQILGRDPYALQHLNDTAIKNYSEDISRQLRGDEGHARAWLLAVIDTLVTHGYELRPGIPTIERYTSRQYYENVIALAGRRKKPTEG